MQDGVVHVDRIAGVRERRAAREKREIGCAKRIQIGSGVRRVSVDKLGGGTSRVDRRLIERRHPEVGDLDAAIVPQQSDARV